MTKPTGRPRGRPRKSAGPKEAPHYKLKKPWTGANVNGRQAPRFMVVKLTTNHTINGVAYGIRECETEVRVREPIAKTLMESEGRVQENNRRFLEPRDALITVGYNNRPQVQYVRRGYFDEAVADVMRGHLAPAFHLTPQDMRA